jgi:hypothetical protein
MKKLAIILAVGAAGLLNVKPANAQIRLGLNLHFGNVGAHVVVAPPVQDVNYSNYDNDDDFYYLPDVEAYYDVAQQCYYYNDGDQWMHAAYLPGRRDYDWRNARRFEVRARRPYMNHDQYRTRFGGFDQRGGNFENRYANRGGFDNRGQQYNTPNRGNYGQPQNNQYQNGGQQNQGRGNYGQPQQGQQGNQYQNGGQQGRGRGNYGQPAGQNNGGQQNQNRGNAQPQNNGGQQSHNGGNRGEEHFAANKMGMMRPARF